MKKAVVATKGNLIAIKNSLKLSRQGFELMDKKRTVLINEMMRLIDRAEEVQSRIDETFAEAYRALQNTNIAEGINRVQALAAAVPKDDSIKIRFRSIMGVEIPEITYKKQELLPTYGFMGASLAQDDAYMGFAKVKELVMELASIENSVYRLAENIKKTQKRANALKNVVITGYEENLRIITNVLEEREREEFTRLKVIKKQKGDS